MVAEFSRAHLTLGLCALFTTGCAAGYRVWAGPTVDTEGRVGGAVGLTVEAGFSSGPDTAVVQELGMALGGRSEPGAATTSASLGYSWVEYLDAATVRLTGRAHFDTEVRADWNGHTTGGPGLALAVGPVLSTVRETRRSLALEINARLAVPTGDAGEVRGVFGGMLVFADRSISRWERCRKREGPGGAAARAR